jgi:hypothetical protein
MRYRKMVLSFELRSCLLDLIFDILYISKVKPEFGCHLSTGRGET